jgi:chromosome segregation ATPase
MTILTIFIFLLILILLLIISLIIINSVQFSHKIGGYRGGGDSDDENDINFLSAIEKANGVILSEYTPSTAIMGDSANTEKLIEDLKNANTQIDLMKEEIIENNKKIANLESNLDDSNYFQTSLQDQIQEIQSEIEEKEQTIKFFMKAAETYNSKSASNRDNNSKELQGLRDQIKELQSEIGQKEQTIKSLIKDADYYNSKSSINRDTNSKELQRLRDKIQELQSEIAKKEQIIESLTKNADDYNSKSSSKRDTIKQLEEVNKNLKESIKTLEDNKSKITYFLQASLKTINNINSKLDISNSAKRDMVKKIKNALKMNSYYY